MIIEFQLPNRAEDTNCNIAGPTWGINGSSSCLYWGFLDVKMISYCYNHYYRRR